LKIVHTVNSYFPEKNGMSEVVKRISEGLVNLGHEVIVLTSKNDLRLCNRINGVEIIDFAIHGNMTYGYYGDIEEYQTFLINIKCDIIVNFAAQQWATDLMLEIIHKISAIKIFEPTGFSGLYNSDYKEYYTKMKNWLNEYDVNIFLGTKCRDYLFTIDNNISSHKIAVIPNGASEIEFVSPPIFNIKEKLRISNYDKIILHVGSYTSSKGHDEALKIFSKLKTNKAVLLFVGTNFTQQESIKFYSKIKWINCFRLSFIFKKWYIKNFFFHLKLLFTNKLKNIHLLSLNREELVDTYKLADLFLFPSNIECSPIVLYEAMASKTPFLVSNVGNSIEINNDSNSGIILPTIINEEGYSHVHIKNSTKIINNFISDDKSIQKKALQGYSIWLKKYTWERIIVEYQNIYIKSIKNKKL
jgi:glycosyltransferase involved in cell wall biosynthesis